MAGAALAVVRVDPVRSLRPRCARRGRRRPRLARCCDVVFGVRDWRPAVVASVAVFWAGTSDPVGLVLHPQGPHAGDRSHKQADECGHGTGHCGTED